MFRRKALITAFGATLVASAAAFAPAAHAERVGFNLSFGGPGYGVTVGNVPYYGYGHGYYGHRYWRPAPVYVAPPVAYVAPPVVYREPIVLAPVYDAYPPYGYRPYYRAPARVYYRY